MFPKKEISWPAKSSRKSEWRRSGLRSGPTREASCRTRLARSLDDGGAGGAELAVTGDLSTGFLGLGLDFRNTCDPFAESYCPNRNDSLPYSTLVQIAFARGSMLY
jgi:hypothetical protein